MTRYSFDEEQVDRTPEFHEIISALSFALDLTEGALPGHSIRTCLLASRIAVKLSLPRQQLAEVYYASLLKDVGCSSNSARMCQIVGGDDRSAKAAARFIDWTKPYKPSLETMRLMWGNVLPGQGIFRKASKLAVLAMTQHRNNKELLTLRCDRGAQIVRKLGLGSTISDAVRHLDEHWNGAGYPSGLSGNRIPIVSRIMAVAQHLDVFNTEKGIAAAIDTLVDRKGVWFDPEIVKAAVALSNEGTLWRHCTAEDAVSDSHTAVLDLRPGRNAVLSDAGVDLICEAFSDVVDAKSPFTYRHSIGVKNTAVAIGSMMGLSKNRIRMLRRTALLHDVGKLSVSNSILDKPGKLTQGEFAVVSAHPQISEQILSRVTSFREIAIVAGQHHERLDGTGYPKRLSKDDLSVESRILAIADVYGALSENRPYRPGLSREEITKIMEGELISKLDRVSYEGLIAALDNTEWAETMKPLTMPECIPAAPEIAASPVNPQPVLRELVEVGAA